MAGELHVGSLTGTVELEDKSSTTLDRLIAKTDQLAASMGGLENSTLKQATALFTAEAAWHAAEKAGELLVDTLKDLTYEGAKIADVEQNFNRLAESSGRLGSTLVKDLQQGTHATVTNFELMRTVNQDLSAGMNLTNEQFKTLSRGAFALAQATGGDVKSAFDTMNDAMLTGRVRSLALLTGKIDLAAAEEKFAARLHTTAEHLSAEGKIEASREAILNAVSAATARLGAQTDGLDEKVDQARTTWRNFEEDLGKTIATSPVVLKAFDDIGRILKEAFGADKDALVKSIVHSVETAAGVAVTFTHVGVDLIKILKSTEAVIIPVGVALVSYVAYVKASELATYGLVLATKALGAAVTTTAGTVALAMGVFTAAYEGTTWLVGLFTKNTDAANDATNAHNTALYAAEEAAKAAAAAQAELGQNTKDTTGFTQESKAEMAAAADAAKKLADIDKEIAGVGKDWHVTLKEVNSALLKNIEHLNENGISMGDLKIKYHLTDAEVKAITVDMQAQQKALDETTKKQKEQADALGRIQDLSRDWGQIADQVPDKLKLEIEGFLKLGASVEDIIKAYPQFNRLQVEAIKHMLDAASASGKQAAAETDVRDSLGLTTSALIARAEAQDKANAAQRAAGGSTDVTRGNLAQNANYWHIPEQVAFEAAKKGFSFAEIVAAWQSGTINQWVPHGPRIPGFREGGVGDFGAGTLAMLHGKEAIIPLDHRGLPASLQVQQFIYGTPTDLVDRVKRDLMDVFLRGRQVSFR